MCRLFYYFFKRKIDLKSVSKSAPESFTTITGGLSKISFFGYWDSYRWKVRISLCQMPKREFQNLLVDGRRLVRRLKRLLIGHSPESIGPEISRK